MIRVLLTEVTPGAAESVRAMLSSLEELEVVGYPRDGLEAAQMAVALQPDILLVHDRLPGMPGIQACELTSLAAPQVACALMCDSDDAATMQRAMRAGARAIVTPATSTDQLAATLRDLAAVRAKTQEREYGLVTDTSHMPRTIVLLSARDGVGKSTLATNLGTVLAQKVPNEVVLVDLSGQFGSTSLLLNLKANGTITDLAGFAAEIDLDLVDTFLSKHKSGLRVLAGGAKPDPAWTDAIGVDFVATLLGLLRCQYRFVLCDVPTLIWPGSLYAITRAQCCLAVTSLFDVTGLQEIALLIDSLVPKYTTSERLKLVVNRAVDHDCFSEQDVSAAAKRKVWHSVPNDTASMFAAANEGEPLVIAKPTSPFSESVVALADKLIDDTKAEA